METYVESRPEGLEGNCYRLPCGHAFHCPCIVQSLRFGNNLCPVCRNSGGSSGTQVANVTVTIHRNPATNGIELGFEGGIPENIDMEEGDAGADESNVSVSSDFLRYNEYELNPLIARIRSTHRPAQVARANLRRAISRYNVFRDRLRANRRRALQIAMSGFRARYNSEFLARLEDISQAFDTTQRIERTEYDMSGQDTPLPVFQLEAREIVGEPGSEFGEYSTRRHDPCNRRFWSY